MPKYVFGSALNLILGDWSASRHSRIPPKTPFEIVSAKNHTFGYLSLLTVYLTCDKDSNYLTCKEIGLCFSFQLTSHTNRSTK